MDDIQQELSDQLKSIISSYSRILVGYILGKHLFTPRAMLQCRKLNSFNRNWYLSFHGWFGMDLMSYSFVHIRL